MSKTQSKPNNLISFFITHKKIIFIILTLAILAGVYVVRSKYKEANPDTPYEIVHIEERSLAKTITVNGEMVSDTEVKLGSDVAGRLVNLYVEVGQLVHKGQAIAKVDDSNQRAQLTQSLGSLQAARSHVESGKVTLAKIKSGTREEQVRMLESSLQSTKNNYASAIQNAKNALTNTYAIVNQSILHGTDILFRNPSKYNPKVDFTVHDSDLRNRLSAVRVDIRYILDRQEDVSVNDINNDTVDIELSKTIEELNIINNFYKDLFNAIDDAVIADETAARYTSIVTPARNAILNQIKAITAMSDAITQKKNSIDIAQANLDQAVTGAQQEDVDVAKVNIDSAKASVLSAEGGYQAAKTALNKTYIHSPQSGVVVDVYKEVGEFVSSAVPIVKISSINKYVSALVSEVDIAKVKTGMSVTVKLDAFADREFAGTVDFIYPDKQEVMGIVYYELKISLNKEEVNDLTILPGMSLDVIIPYETKDNVSAIERSVAKQDAGKYFVQIINQNKKKPIDNKFSKIYFESGFVGDDYIEVLSGLAQGVGIVKLLPTQSNKKSK